MFEFRLGTQHHSSIVMDQKVISLGILFGELMTKEGLRHVIVSTRYGCSYLLVLVYCLVPAVQGSSRRQARVMNVLMMIMQGMCLQKGGMLSNMS